MQRKTLKARATSEAAVYKPEFSFSPLLVRNKYGTDQLDWKLCKKMQVFTGDVSMRV